MSEKVDTGGSAFACKYGYGFGSVGMTLLDYFAGQIAAGELSHESGGWVDRDDFAHYCYQRAAALVRRKRELERTGEE